MTGTCFKSKVENPLQNRFFIKVNLREDEPFILEGNYLLLDETPWTDLQFDTTVFLDVPMDEVERRLLGRWRSLEGDALRAKMEENDLPNARLVVEHSRDADFRLRNV